VRARAALKLAVSGWQSKCHAGEILGFDFEPFDWILLQTNPSDSDSAILYFDDDGPETHLHMTSNGDAIGCIAEFDIIRVFTVQ
jgi:hypothetical protein